ncbi:hypothetical protein [Streptomyces phaeochromogenes]
MAAEMTEAFAATVAAVAPVVLLVAVVEVAGYERERRARGHRLVTAAASVDYRAEDPRIRSMAMEAIRLMIAKDMYEMFPGRAQHMAAQHGVLAPVSGMRAWARWMQWIAWLCSSTVMVAQAVAAIIALNALRDLSVVSPIADDVCAVIVSVGLGWVALWPIARVMLASTWGRFVAMTEHSSAHDPFLKAVQDRIDWLEAEQARQSPR